MKKRGQEVFGMSFGTLFSIIAIIAIVFVAFYTIRHFLDLNKCTQIGFFYDEFGEKVESVWTSGGAEDVFEGSLPTSGILSADISHVCFGDLSQINTAPDTRSKQIGDDLVEYYNRDDLPYNVFIYPSDDSCMPHKNVLCRGDKSNCLKTEPAFFCVEVISGKATVELFLQKGGGGPVTVRPST